MALRRSSEMSDEPTLGVDFTPDPIAAAYVQDEGEIVSELLAQIGLSKKERLAIHEKAVAIVQTVRADTRSKSAIDDLLQEYGLSTGEGVTLMRLAEALIRTPDFPTSRTLIRDKIGEANWKAHQGRSHSFLVNQATNGLRITSAWIASTGGTRAKNLLARLGDQVMDRAVAKAMSIMGEHFVLGKTIDQAIKRGAKSEAAGFSHSYDMLGEAACTQHDADQYFEAYLHAIKTLAKSARTSERMASAPGLSVKLSALHPRYDYAHRTSCVPILIDRVTDLARIAKASGLWLNIDAEEADRLETSLLVFDELLTNPNLNDWSGLGLVIQAYQRRAMPVIDHVINRARQVRRQIAIRLVKGAYWDMEIKRAQELGLESYPVFTRKENTDLSYLACARKLLASRDFVFPQFATHNAQTASAIAKMAGNTGGYEFQRLHGMGESLHESLMSEFGVPSRIYAPVGNHKDLLPYLVRRLLENGANSSFVNQLMDNTVAIEEVVSDPISTVEANESKTHPNIPAPRDILEDGRLSALGVDLTQSWIADQHMQHAQNDRLHTACSRIFPGVDKRSTSMVRFSPQNITEKVGHVSYSETADVERAIQAASRSDWAISFDAAARSNIFSRCADLLEAEMEDFLELCVREAGKTLPDAVAEVREAIDFCRYYGGQAQRPDIQKRPHLGVVACISPWNFPLAIFLGQIVAALSVGNTVVAKPAEQTPFIATKAVDLLYRAGLPRSALQLLIGDGAELGTALTRHEAISGVCFTGSTRTAKRIAQNLAETERADIPFIAETGGINTMIVDSTALLEQAVQDVVDSAFQSAGQRCSACRIVCVQEDIYEPFLEMLIGAMDELIIGDPSDLATDIGPVIDAGARDMIDTYKADAEQAKKVLKTM